MNTERSRALFAHAQEIIPGGVNSPVRACRNVHADPLFIAEAQGSHLTTVDGDHFIDFYAVTEEYDTCDSQIYEEGGFGFTVDNTAPVLTVGQNAAENVENPELTTRQKHTRECFVVAADGADKARIEREICEMPNYFADYNTTVTFITAEEMARDHAGLPHGGEVIRNGRTGIHGLTSHTIRYSLRLESNPEFTASAIVAFARAVYRMKQRGRTGCITVLDVAPADLSPLSPEELRAHML